MTDSEITIAVAELDEKNLCNGQCGEKDCMLDTEGMQVNYTTSRDAIIPVIEKLGEGRLVSSNPHDYPRWMFSSYLLQDLGLTLWENGEQLGVTPEIAWLIIKATPRQLCIALLKATGKYHE